MEQRVALLNAATSTQWQRIVSENFRRDVDAHVEDFRVADGELPGTFDWDAVVVSGSAASVYWDEEWITDAEAWVEAATEREIPVLGVCFGHQLVASALGGDVVDMGEYEIGYNEIRRVRESALLDGLPDEFLAFSTHSDEVVELPEGAERIAQNEYGLQGFQYGNSFGVQFHPEYDPDSAYGSIEEKDELPAEQRHRAMESVTEENYEAAQTAKELFDNFLDCAAIQS